MAGEVVLCCHIQWIMLVYLTGSGWNHVRSGWNHVGSGFGMVGIMLDQAVPRLDQVAIMLIRLESGWSGWIRLESCRMRLESWGMMGNNRG